MITDTFDQRWQQIGAVWREYVLEYRILLIVALVVAGLWVFGSNGFNLAGDMLGYITNVATESLSIIVTVLILDRLNQRRADQRAGAALKEDLVRRAGSISNSIAVDAVAELDKRGWLEGDKGLLVEADLIGANLGKARLLRANLEHAFLLEAQLQGANLWEARLREVTLTEAQLQEANLWRAQLQGADLSEAQLQRANLFGVQLQGADLSEAQLQGASLWKAQLQRANLFGVQLQGASLWEANLVRARNIQHAAFDTQTLLPDAQAQRHGDGNMKKDAEGNLLYTAASYWTPETDMTRYTDPEHPDSWQYKWQAAGFETQQEWREAGGPCPWREAGYGDDHIAWIRAGKPESLPLEHPNSWQPEWVAAGVESPGGWARAGKPQPWREAGYGEDHMAWVRAGKPGPLPLEHPNSWWPAWKAMDFESKQDWKEADYPQPWREAGYGEDHMAWVRAGKPDPLPLEHPNSWQPEWAAAGFKSSHDWYLAGFSQPWRKAGYGDDHMAWVRAGKPDRKPNAGDET